MLTLYQTLFSVRESSTKFIWGIRLKQNYEDYHRMQSLMISWARKLTSIIIV